MAKIAVRCPTKDLWNPIQKKIQETVDPKWNPKNICWDSCKEKTCIAEEGVNGPGFADESYWIQKDYTIISAEEYLGIRPKQKNSTRKIGSLGIDFSTIIKRG